MKARTKIPVLIIDTRTPRMAAMVAAFDKSAAINFRGV